MNEKMFNNYYKLLSEYDLSDKPVPDVSTEEDPEEEVAPIHPALDTSDGGEDADVEDISTITPSKEPEKSDKISSKKPIPVPKKGNQSLDNLNSLYSVGDDYKENHFKFVNGFWVSCLGLLALAERFPESEILHNYLMKPYPITEEDIEENGDYSTDIIASTKALYDNGTMKYYTWVMFMIYFRELAQQGYKNINIEKFLELTKEMLQVEIRPHQLIIPTIYAIVDKKIKLEDVIMPLYQFNELYKLSPNFRKFCLVHRKEIFGDVRDEHQ